MDPLVSAACGLMGEASLNRFKDRVTIRIARRILRPRPLALVCRFDNSTTQKQAGKDWEAALKDIMSFGTVQEFWHTYSSITPASRTASGSNWSLFRAGIKPMWEDPVNKQGGKWVLTINRSEKRNLDDWWLYAVLASIGEVLETAQGHDEICGLVCSIRKDKDRIALWTKSAADMELQHQIGTHFRQILNLPSSVRLQYQTHDDALSTGSSFRNST